MEPEYFGSEISRKEVKARVGAHLSQVKIKLSHCREPYSREGLGREILLAQLLLTQACKAAVWKTCPGLT